MRFCILIVFVLLLLNSFGQNIKQLENKLLKADKVQKVEICVELATLYFSRDKVKAIKYAEDALKYMSKIKKPSYGLQSKVYSTLGAVHYNNQNINKSIKYYEEEIKIIEKKGTTRQKMNACYNLGTLYKHTIFRKDKSYKYHQKSLAYAKKIKDNDMISLNYKILYEMNSEDKNLDATVYLRLYNEFNDSLFKIKTQNEIILLNDEKRKIEGELVQKDSAIGELEKETENKKVEIENLTTIKKIQEDSIKYQKEVLERKEIEAQQQRYITILISIILLIAVVFFVIVYRKNKLLKRANKTISSNELELSQKNEHINESIRYAREIQKSLLFPEQEIQTFFTDIFIFSRPLATVSGDFYWFQELEDKFVIAVGDCTGHGVPGALMSIIGNNLLHQIVVNNQILNPAIILQELHNGVNSLLQQKKENIVAQDGMDIGICVIEPLNNKMEYAGAKINLHIVKNGELSIVKADYYSIGGKPFRKNDNSSFEYTNHIINYEPNTCFYLFTDGYMDQFGGPEHIKFNAPKFKEILLENSEKSMQSQKEIFEHELKSWQDTEKSTDDVLVIGFKL